MINIPTFIFNTFLNLHVFPTAPRIINFGDYCLKTIKSFLQNIWYWCHFAIWYNKGINGNILFMETQYLFISARNVKLVFLFISNHMIIPTESSLVRAFLPLPHWTLDLNWTYMGHTFMAPTKNYQFSVPSPPPISNRSIA